MSIEEGVVFHTVAGRELKLDIYRPDSASTRAAVLLFHGGGWSFGERGMMAPLAAGLSAKGFVAMAVQYRLLGEAPWPAQLEDVVAAVRWTTDNTQRLGVRSGRIVVAGSSAGGHLALLAAATVGRSQVGAVIANFPIVELVVEPPPEHGLMDAARLLGPNPTDEDARSVSPLHRITADSPPVFLLHGSADWALDPLTSLRMYEKLLALGVPAELHMVAAANHEFVSEPLMVGPMATEMALFLDRVLIDPERWNAESRATNFFAKGRPSA
jgi:acetyl esterase/lipase